VAASVAIPLVLAIVLSPARRLIVERVREMASPFAGPGNTRVDIWKTAWAMWRERALLGQGPDTFGIVFTRFQPAEFWRLEWNHVAWHAHSIYLHTLATRGVLGIVAAAGCTVSLGFALRAAWRRGGRARETVAPLAGALAALAVAGSSGALGIAGAVALTVLIAGAASQAVSIDPAVAPRGTAPARAPRRPGGAKAPSLGAWSAGLAAAAIALVASACDLNGLWAAGEARRWVDHGGLAAAAGGEAEAGELAARAQVWGARAPWSDLVPRTASELLMTWAAGSSRPLELLRVAERSAREAVRRVPLRAANHRRLADVLGSEAMLGDSTRTAATEASFARAAALAPCDAFILLEWARDRLAMGNPWGALEPARRAVALYPDRGFALEILGEALLGVRDSTGARAAFERAVAGRWSEEPGARARASRLLEALGPGSARNDSGTHCPILGGARRDLGSSVLQPRKRLKPHSRSSKSGGNPEIPGVAAGLGRRPRRRFRRLRVQHAEPRARLGELLAMVFQGRQREGFEHPVLGDPERAGVMGNLVVRGQGAR